MPLVVKTIDASALVDSDLDDLAAMGGAFGIGAISKAKEDWVLFASAKLDGKLHGFMFSTLERIGGTPCVLLGMLSVKRTSKRDQILKGLMSEAYHRFGVRFGWPNALGILSSGPWMDLDRVVDGQFMGPLPNPQQQGPSSSLQILNRCLCCLFV